tara:strand:+ start:636 stop:899 length:264 start_codon:yes stop_codon:yes gene_type:complete
MEIKSPDILNGVQLQKELKAANIDFGDYPRLNDGILGLDIAKKDEAKARAIVEAHIGIDNSAEIAAAKAALLDKLGITSEEASLLLS